MSESEGEASRFLDSNIEIRSGLSEILLQNPNMNPSYQYTDFLFRTCKDFKFSEQNRNLL